MIRREECPVCCGDGELGRAGEDGLTAVKNVRCRTRGLYEASRRTLATVRRYVAECIANGWDPATDSRIILCLDTVRAYRASIRYHRASLTPRSYERLAWCVACRGLGLAEILCEGCGKAVDRAAVNDDALDNVDVLVHDGCDTGHRFFDVATQAAGWR